MHYALDEIEVGESRNGQVSKSVKGQKLEDKTEDVLVAGADTYFIQKQGLDCDYKWIPHETKENLESEMDPSAANTIKADYHSLASLLKVQKKEYSGEESPTDYIIQHWCHSKGKRMTFGMLYTILKHPGIIGNEEAARVVAEMLHKHGHQVRTWKRQIMIYSSAIFLLY